MGFSMNEATSSTARKQGAPRHRPSLQPHFAGSFLMKNGSAALFFLLTWEKARKGSVGKQADVTNTSICDGGAAGGTWCSSVNAQGGRIKAKEGRSGNNLLGRLPPPSHGTAGNRIHLQSQALTLKKGFPSHLIAARPRLTGEGVGASLRNLARGLEYKYSWLRSPLAVNFLNHFHRGRRRNAGDLRDESK